MSIIDKINRQREDAARERILQKKIQYNEEKKAVRERSKAYKEKGLTDDEAEYMAERQLKRDKKAAKVKETQKKLAAITEGFGDGKPDRKPATKKQVKQKAQPKKYMTPKSKKQVDLRPDIQKPDIRKSLAGANPALLKNPNDPRYMRL